MELAGKTIIVSGSGLVARHLCRRLLEYKAKPVVLSRHPAYARDYLPDAVDTLQWNPADPDFKLSLPADTWAVISLAGEPVAQRWSFKVKQRIRDSRVAGTIALAHAMQKLPHPPQCFVSASAVGYYGDCQDREVVESSPPSEDFLGVVCQQWEEAARQGCSAAARGLVLRLGIVLARDGGALKKMLPPFQCGVGGPLGTGRHWMSWIHIDDLVNLILYVLEHDRAVGTWNAVSPHPVTNLEFSQTLAKTLHRPCWLPAPRLAMQLVFGEMAAALLFTSQRVFPTGALAAGFQFKYPDIQAALADLLPAKR